MKLFLLPLIFIANFAFASIPQIDSIVGASRVAAHDGVITAYLGMAPACDTFLSGACHANPLPFDSAVPVLKVVFKHDVSQIRIAHGFWTLPTNKNLADKSLSIVMDDICGLSSMGYCSNIDGSKTLPLAAYVDANGNGIMDAAEDAIALHVKVLNPDPMVWGTHGLSTDGIGGPQGFIPFPGDGAVYLSDLEMASNFPMLGYGSKITKVRVFASNIGLEKANLIEASRIVDLELAPDGSGLIDNKIDGLQNGTAYVFRIVMLDEAENMVLHFPAPSADATCDAGAPFVGCPWAATPEAVIGR